MLRRTQKYFDSRFGSIEELLKQILRKERKLMTLIEDLQREVAELTTVNDSVVTLLQNLKAQLEAAGTDPAKLQEIVNALDAQATRLADAVVANTPSA